MDRHDIDIDEVLMGQVKQRIYSLYEYLKSEEGQAQLKEDNYKIGRICRKFRLTKEELALFTAKVCEISSTDNEKEVCDLIYKIRDTANLDSILVKASKIDEKAKEIVPIKTKTDNNLQKTKDECDLVKKEKPRPIVKKVQDDNEQLLQAISSKNENKKNKSKSALKKALTYGFSSIAIISTIATVTTVMNIDKDIKDKDANMIAPSTNLESKKPIQQKSDISTVPISAPEIPDTQSIIPANTIMLKKDIEVVPIPATKSKSKTDNETKKLENMSIQQSVVQAQHTSNVSAMLANVDTKQDIKQEKVDKKIEQVEYPKTFDEFARMVDEGKIIVRRDNEMEINGKVYRSGDDFGRFKLQHIYKEYIKLYDKKEDFAKRIYL